VGLYGFRRQALLDFLGRAPGRLEKAENLEQLRFLENGERIIVGVIEAIPPGVDTPRDLERIQGRFTANEGHGGDPSAGSSPPGKDGVGSG
jgi:CMP-2-keto-3-deoxyoctulosonic acid synthetase